MRIAIASHGDPFAISTWSGIPANIAKALKERHHTVLPVFLQKPKDPWYYDWYRRFYYRFQKKWFLAEVEPRILKQMAKQLDDAVQHANPDVVIIIHGDFLAYATFDTPAVIVHDATFASLLDYYPAFSNLTERSVKAGNLMYKMALEKANAAVFSASWASRSAENDYGTAVDKIHTIPFGANLDVVPDSAQVAEWISVRANQNVCNFLFLGVDWERKGGPDALEFVIELNRRGVAARLWIAGCSPSIDKKARPYVVNFGYLRKDVEEDVNTLSKLLVDAHALLLPSIAECFGCVYCEANAYGLPAIGRATGGVPEIIKNGINGLLLEMDESPAVLAERWKEIWVDKHRYQQLSLSSRMEYTDRLNYEVFVQEFELVLSPIFNKTATINVD